MHSSLECIVSFGYKICDIKCKYSNLTHVFCNMLPVVLGFCVGLINWSLDLLDVCSFHVSIHWFSMSLSADSGEWQDGGVHQYSGHVFSQCCTHAHTPETQRHPTGLLCYSFQFSPFIFLLIYFPSPWCIWIYTFFYFLWNPNLAKAL